MSDISFGLYGDAEYTGGNYNMLSSFNVGLYKALKTRSLNVKFVYEYIEANTLPDLAIAFNVFGFDYWKKLMDLEVMHLMWSVDSPFLLNFRALKMFHNNPNFIFGCVSPIDKEAVASFFPDLKFLYLSHATDPDIWYPDESEKKYDIVFMSSLSDYEEEIRQIKENAPPQMYNVFMYMYEYAMNNPDVSFWNLYKNICEMAGLDLNNPGFYTELFNRLCYLVTYTRRVQLIKKLKNFNVKIWGSPVWTKYIEGKAEYMGVANLFEAAEITRKSKISLHLQPMQILNGLHERPLNALASGSFVMSDFNPAIQESFGDSICYYDNKGFKGLADQLQYYLRNGNERIQKTNTAREIVLQNHTWANRAEELLNIFVKNTG